MITAVFTDNSDYARATGLWQWDYGQRLRIEGLKLPTAVEIHFALTEQSGDAITRVGTTKDGVTEVVIPESLLENQAIGGATYEIYAWIYLADKTSGETIKRICLQVKCRPKPEAFDAPGDVEIFRDAIEQVNTSADRAEAAQAGAEAAKTAAEAVANKIEGEIVGAGQIAEQVKQNAEAVAKDKQTVTQMVAETAQSAQKATQEAQAAESSSITAKKAQTAAEAAETGATAAMEEVERDRTEVSNTHRLVEQMRDSVDLDKQAVAANRQAVENTATQFGQTAQNALKAVGQAKSDAVGVITAEGKKQATAVTTEGEKHVAAVQQAGTQAVSGVGAAKAEAVKAITTEGDAQTKRVQDAAAGIVADREQIAANKAGITTLKEDLNGLDERKADVIVETASGNAMTLTDSSEKPFRGLRVFGKSTQDGVPSIENPVPIVSAGESGNITITVGGDKPQSLVLATPNGLPGVPVTKNGNYTDSNGQQWICDEIDLAKGKYVQMLEVVKAANLMWNNDFFTSNTKTFYRYTSKNLLNALIDRSDGFSNCFRYKTGFSIKPNEFIVEENGKIRVVLESPVENIDALMEMFRQKGTVFCVPRITPIERDLTPEEIAAYKALHTNHPTTVIANDVRAHMEVSYVADTKKYIQNIEDRLNAKLVNIQSALINQKISGGGIKVADSAELPIQNLRIFGKSIQDGIPTPEKPVPIISSGEKGKITLSVNEKKLVLFTPNGLHGIKVNSGGNYTDNNGQQWICDEIDLAKGKYVQRVKEFIINQDTKISTELGKYEAPEKDTILARYSNKAIKKAGPILCRELPTFGNWSLEKESVFATEQSIDFRFSRKRLGLGTETTTTENKTAVLKFLETTPLHCLAILNSPIEHNLTPEEITMFKKLHMTYQSTTISNDENAEMELTYTVDTKSYVDKKIAEISTAIVKGV